MSGSIIGPRRKLDWAQRHLDTLRREVKPFFETYGDPFDSEFDAVEQCHVFLFRERKPIPKRWGLIVGDVVASARSALDHLVFQLVLANGGTPGRNTSFPVALTEGWWLDNVECRPQRRGPGPLDGISDTAWAKVKGLQPYHAGDRETAQLTWLGGLNALWNIDKHQVIHDSHALLPGMEPEISVSPQGVARLDQAWFVSTQTLLLDGESVVKARVQVDTRVPNPNVEVHVNLPLTVAFGVPGEFLAPVPAIVGAVRGVGIALNLFEEEFPA